jgi:acyl phosphate:glycerol-3-phosphate acyltransferase
VHIFFLIAAISYFLGSIPFGYLLVRMFRGEDVRLSGSGNIGATNVSRKSPALGALTLLLDALKGSAAVWIARVLANRVPDVSSQMLVLLASEAALFAVLGHMFSVWLKFRGGKGVATGLGSFAMVAPKAALIAAAIFLFVAILSHYVSLASITAAAAFPFMVLFMHEHADSTFALLVMAFTSLLIVARHHENIRRLLAGAETRAGSRAG